MQLVDTHCHLDLGDYSNDLDEVLTRAKAAGVVRMIVPGISLESSKKAVALSETYGEVFAACGIHPHEADRIGGGDLAELRELAMNSEKTVAIGEIGLDHYKKFSGEENQRKMLEELLQIASELDLPVIMHNREAGNALFDMLKHTGYHLKGVMHCFSGDIDMMQKTLDHGMYISFTGSITFKNAGAARDLARLVRPERLLLETDSPYMTPMPFRGKRNEPAYVKYLLDIYAEVYGLTVEDIARITTHNADELFCLGLEGKAAVTYAIRDSLYINLTNRCTNKCGFCVRQTSDYVKGHKLSSDTEPSSEEIINALGDIGKYKEIVFCGYGEPTLRFGTVKKVASYIKSKGGKVRVTTNGEGNLINGRDITPEMKGLVDRVAVSLNAPDEAAYTELCKPVFGDRAYGSILGFIKGCVDAGIEVEITCLDMIGDERVKGCREIAEKMGASFRMRHMGAVG
ncbi:MAG: TatD family hydrolase [Candidatus Omnitrophota bacterium]